MLNQNLLLRKNAGLLIAGIFLPLMIVLSSFNHFPGPKPVCQATGFPYSGYIPYYQMSPATVRDIISGLPLDKRIILQFVITGSRTDATEVLWYKASGMESHGEGRIPKTLDPIAGTQAIDIGETEKFVLANNYLFVKDLKEYVRGLPSQDYLYLEFKAIKNASNNHVYFNVKAVFEAATLKNLGYRVPDGAEKVYSDPGINSHPSPPASTQQE